MSEEKKEDEIKNVNMVCFYLIKICRDAGAETMTIAQDNVTVNGEKIGDWEIVVRKKK